MHYVKLEYDKACHVRHIKGQRDKEMAKSKKSTQPVLICIDLIFFLAMIEPFRHSKGLISALSHERSLHDE